ncbi:MAG: CHC2 zinc finger domain-containing protein, partial [Desulfosalsimonas sp.]
QSWRCFGGCNDGGDMFDFIMKIEGVEFPEALKILAKKAGVEIKAPDKKKAGKKEKFYQLYDLATKFFEKQMEASKRGKKAQEYLLSRGISEEAIKNWRLGYSPDSWQALSEFLISKVEQYRVEEVQPVDMFPHTFHIEAVARLVKKTED